MANSYRPILEALECRELLTGYVANGGPLAPAPTAYVRVNQVGYAPGTPNQAFLMAGASEKGATFQVLDGLGQTVYSAPIGPNQGAWSKTFPDVYLLDFAPVTATGTYTIEVCGPIPAQSPSFSIDTGANLYSGLLSNALFFYQSQQDGPNVNPAVMQRQPSHLTDASAFVYQTPKYKNDVLQGKLIRIGGPIDVSGGWFDAGDYIKLVETASYTDAVMLLAARDYSQSFPGGAAAIDAQARVGLDWLMKMWDDKTLTLYYQVGIGDGNGKTILGDHDVWRLPQADDQLNVQPGDPEYYIKYRPVFRAGPPGSPISPNLAGRLAADFALGYQIYRTSDPTYAAGLLLAAEHVFALAKTHDVGQLLTATPHDYYPEVEWRDDMELGATELYFATAAGNLPAGLPQTNPLFYLQQAAHWAKAYINGPNDGSDSLNLYDVSGLAHYELYHAITQAGNPAGLAVTQADLLANLGFQLNLGVAQAKHDPFGLGIAYGTGTDMTPHALGYALEASFYDELANTDTYAAFGSEQLNWVLGENAWGSSFIVGAGSTFPHNLQSQIANLAGSLNGTPPILLGATVDGQTTSGVSRASACRPAPIPRRRMAAIPSRYSPARGPVTGTMPSPIRARSRPMTIRR